MVTTYSQFLNEQNLVEFPKKNMVGIETIFKSVVKNSKKIVGLPYFKGLGLNLEDVIKNAMYIVLIENGRISLSDIKKDYPTNKKSYVGAIGIMQIKPETKEDMEERILKSSKESADVLYGVDKNIYYGIVYLLYNYKRISKDSNILKKNKNIIDIWQNSIVTYNMGSLDFKKLKENSEARRYLEKYKSLSNSQELEKLIKELSHKYYKADFSFRYIQKQK